MLFSMPAIIRTNCCTKRKMSKGYDVLLHRGSGINVQPSGGPTKEIGRADKAKLCRPPLILESRSCLIRLPFVVEGFSLGMIGAILAFGLEWLGYDAMIAKIGSVDALQLFNFVPFQELLLPMVATFAAAGMFVGIVGSWTSIRKFMDV